MFVLPFFFGADAARPGGGPAFLPGRRSFSCHKRNLRTQGTSVIVDGHGGFFLRFCLLFDPRSYIIKPLVQSGSMSQRRVALG